MLRAAALIAALALAPPALARGPLVFLTDFGTRDGAVSAMKGVAYGISQRLVIGDVTHEVTSIWEGAFRLDQAAPFWPAGTVFVAVVDPGVGTERLPVVLRTRAGRLYVGPDNGLFTLVAEREGVAEARRIDEKNRRPGSEESHTFHGRDLFGYTGARLAAGALRIAQVGPRLDPAKLVAIAYARPERSGDRVKGVIPVLDVAWGNVWTNIPKALFESLRLSLGDRVRVRIFKKGTLVDETVAPYRRTFGEVPPGQPLVYVNSLMQMAIALGQDSYAARHKIDAGPDWTVEFGKE